MSDFKYGQRVRYSVSGLNGTGKIVGKAMDNRPIIGGVYIIEPDDYIRNEAYDFTHFIANETQFTLIEKSEMYDIFCD